MKKETNRRSFVKKAIALTSGTFIALKTNFAFTRPKKVIPTLRNIKPLGFQWETLDPFLFCVHHEDFFPKGNEQMGPACSLAGRDLGQDFMIKDGFRMYHGRTVPGFPGHPHRGFETITVVRKGMVDHSDSMGASGRYGDGDVQWMTAGQGVQHAEMFPLLNKEKENPMELFQIWLNLPKRDKMVEPHFKMLWSESIPHYNYTDINGRQTDVEIIVGQLSRKKAPLPPPDSWAFNSKNEVAIWNIRMEAGAKWKLPKASTGLNRKLYFYEGKELTIDGQNIPFYHSVEVDADTELTLESGGDISNILLLQGKPISELVVQHGPFVMNTREEIKQAFEDYQQTQFGGWPWNKADPVHSRSKGRFAFHADGRKELKD